MIRRRRGLPRGLGQAPVSRNVVQAPEVIQRLSRFLGIRQLSITPTLSDVLQPVVVVADTSRPTRGQTQDPCVLGGYRDAPGVNRGLALAISNPLSAANTAPKVFVLRRVTVNMVIPVVPVSDPFRFQAAVHLTTAFTGVYGGASNLVDFHKGYSDVERHPITGVLAINRTQPNVDMVYWVSAGVFLPSATGGIVVGDFVLPVTAYLAPPFVSFDLPPRTLLPPGYVFTVGNIIAAAAPGLAFSFSVVADEEDPGAGSVAGF